MAEFPFFYPYSRGIAADRDELLDWKESHHINIACARSIESAIKNLYGKEDNCAKYVIERYGFKRVNFVLANTIQRLSPDSEKLIIAEAKDWAREIYVPDEGSRNRRYEVNAPVTLLGAFTCQAQEAYRELNLFDSKHCEAGDTLDYTDKVLVLSPDTLREDCWNPKNQLWLALDGFGCSPTARGRSIRCICLGDGETTRWNRDEFIGALKEEYLPDWADEKLAELRPAGQDQAPSAGKRMDMAQGGL